LPTAPGEGHRPCHRNAAPCSPAVAPHESCSERRRRLPKTGTAAGIVSGRQRDNEVQEMTQNRQEMLQFMSEERKEDELVKRHEDRNKKPT